LSVANPNRISARVTGRTCAGLLALSSVVLTGCETDSFLDPSKVGYWEQTPTTLPILNRLDVVERETTSWGQLSKPTPEDLQPGELQYKLAASDEIRVEIFELVSQGQTEIMLRTIDPSGNIRLPTIGEVPAAGLTVAQLQKAIEDRLKSMIAEPLVSVILERGQGFTFVIYGAVQGTGVYGLSRPDFKLMEALALAGGTVSTTKNVYVIRSAPLDDAMRPVYGDRGLTQPSGDGGAAGGGTNPGSTPTQPDVDINELINRLQPTPPADAPPTPPKAPEAPPAGPGMGMVSGRHQDGTADKPPVDIDDLTGESAAGANEPSSAGGTATGEGWVWDAGRQEWVRGTQTPGSSLTAPARPTDRVIDTNLFATRIIQIDYQALSRGEMNLNVIVRPGDQIFVEPPVDGLVIIGGEISRPGVYELPQNGEMTLSRLVDVAGGLGPLAISQRVDLIRRVGPSREAAVRIDLGAIRSRAEPDILLKPDDHVIIGTNFFAAPLAVIRNGFRMTYGFGFLLDRNFGNDVFGAPPTNVLGE
jgi:polysaccharide export outer membrane protein